MLLELRLGQVLALPLGELLAAFEHFFIDAVGGAEEGRHLVEIALLPGRERMIVALGAGHVGAEKGREQIGHAIERHLGVVEQEAGGAVVAELAIGGEHGADEGVPRAVGVELVLEPVLEGEGRDVLAEGVLDP